MRPLQQTEIAELDNQIAATNDKITEILNLLESKENTLQLLSRQIEQNESRLAESEEQFALRTIRSIEETTEALALHKILVTKHCPYCAQANEELALLALDRLRHGLCPVCGLNHIEVQALPEPSSLTRALLSSESQRANLLAESEALKVNLNELRGHDAKLRSMAASVKFTLPRITPREKVVVLDDENNLRSLLATYQSDHLRRKQLHDDRKAALEQRYAELVSSHARSFRLIEARALSYATAFLGTTCSFSRTESSSIDRNARFSFPVLVPNFNDRTRTSSGQCSESQAFFLDIAFRIALIEVAQTLSGTSSTFICETPENALDLAYAENVAEMFAEFSKANGSSLMTANLQAGGVAQPLLKSVPTVAERRKRILNLLEHAELSAVQQGKRAKLDSQLAALLSP